MHLHLDCQFGMAGDMLLAALVDAGADKDAILEALAAIPLEGFDLECRRTTRGGVAAMQADVKDLTTSHRCHDGHDHHHDHHGHVHGGDPQHDTCQASQGPHRHLGDLMKLLDAESIAPRARERAARIFRILAEAEATVHGQPVDKVHFHEISGIDTAVDVIGSCVALELLEVDSVTASSPAVGSGMIMCEHGIFPVPAPATLEILKSHNIPWQTGGEGERTTPTGAALLAGLADGYGSSPELTVTRIGYGAGHREFADMPNLLRAIIGKPGKPGASRRSGSSTVITETEPEISSELVHITDESSYLPAQIASQLPGDKAPTGDRVAEFRFAVDDMTPEAIGHLCEACFAAGALDAYAMPAVMKKGRPGHEVTVLAASDLAALIADVIWRESSTFGMRVGERSRLTLPRDTRHVVVHGQKIRVKIGWRNGVIVRRQPEYEDCRAATQATGAPLEEVFTLAKEAARELE